MKAMYVSSFESFEASTCARVKRGGGKTAYIFLVFCKNEAEFKT